MFDSGKISLKPERKHKDSVRKQSKECKIEKNYPACACQIVTSHCYQTVKVENLHFAFSKSGRVHVCCDCVRFNP